MISNNPSVMYITDVSIKLAKFKLEELIDKNAKNKIINMTEMCI